jgi:hypothetical protein
MEFVYETLSEELPLMQVMNSLAFQESSQAKKLDANFISVYNTEKKEFEYYVQRMLGVHISNEGQPARGRIWVPYVNAQREDWSFICENNRVVSPDDEIVFRYELAFQSP